MGRTAGTGNSVAPRKKATQARRPQLESPREKGRESPSETRGPARQSVQYSAPEARRRGRRGRRGAEKKVGDAGGPSAGGASCPSHSAAALRLRLRVARRTRRHLHAASADSETPRNGRRLRCRPGPGQQESGNISGPCSLLGNEVLETLCTTCICVDSFGDTGFFFVYYRFGTL